MPAKSTYGGDATAASAPADAEYEAEYAEGDMDADAIMDAPEPAMREEMSDDAGYGGAPPPAPPMEQRFAQSGAQPPAQSAPKSRPKAPESTPDTGQPGQIAAPLLIYEATLFVAVFEADKAIAEVERLARDSGGYLVRRDDRTIVFRVPSERFESTVDTIAKIGDVLHRELTVEDVTEQFYDIKTRLRNLHAVRDRFEKLLEKADTVKDALEVQRELERVTTQIEALEGRMKVLRELIRFSTITVEFKPSASESVSNRVHLPFPWLDSLGLGSLLSM